VVSTILDMKSALLGYATVYLLHSHGSVLTICQESFYSKLKKFSDECNTNLYVSNIPKNFNEHVRMLLCVATDISDLPPRNLPTSLLPTKFAQAGYSVIPPVPAAGLGSLGQ
jgi:hypothetical protein